MEKDEVVRVVIDRAGGYEQLQVVHLDAATALEPTLGGDEVRVEAVAVGVNYADVCVRMGLYASAARYVGWPITPGFEFAGRVVAVGAEVTERKVGECVVGVTRFGAYSSHITVPQDQLFPIPSGFSFTQMAGVPSVFLTAYYAMFELVHPHSWQTLLVHSAAGGVGSSLVQLGKKIAGCKVVGVVGSSHKVQTVYDLGADHVIDKSKENLWEKAREYSPEGYDAVFDANGVETLKESYNHLSCGGKLVIYGFHTMLPKQGGKPNWLKLARDWLWTPSFDPLKMTEENKSVLAFNLSFMFDKKAILADMFRQLLAWLKEGRLVVPPITAFPIEQVADAHKLIESGKSVGKIVLTTQFYNEVADQWWEEPEDHMSSPPFECI